MTSTCARPDFNILTLPKNDQLLEKCRKVFKLHVLVCLQNKESMT